MAQEPVEPDGQAESQSHFPGDAEPEDPPGLSTQGVIPGLLAVGNERDCHQVYGPVVHLGHGV